jgi:hypothetical protein
LAYLFNGKKDWTIKKIITLDFKKKKSSGHSMCGQDQVSTLTDNKESVGGRKTSIFTTNISI